MKGTTTIVAMIVLLSSHIIKGDFRCFRNFRRISWLADEGPGILWRMLRRGQNRPTFVRARAKRIRGRFGRRRDEGSFTSIA